MNPIKTYYLIHIYFGDNLVNKYTVYSYEKSRRFTANQAWQHIRNNSSPVFAQGALPKHATIYNDQNIIQRYNLDAERCNRYCTFGFIH